jgi:hypothetical protein
VPEASRSDFGDKGLIIGEEIAKWGAAEI